MSFTEFNKSIFKDNNIQWFDRTGILKIDKNRRAEISLRTNGIADVYNSYFVKIIHKENGQISVKNFLFDDYMDITASSKRHNLYVGGFSVNIADRVDWYIAIPLESEINKLVNSIMSFIEMYR